MKLGVALPLLSLLFLACSSTTTDAPATPAPGEDAGGDVESPDAGADARPTNDAYEQSVLAARWTKLAAGPSYRNGAKMDDVFFTSKLVGYAADGPASAIRKTEDGGATWKDVFTHEGTFFRALTFLDDQHGFAGNLGAGLTASVSDVNVLYETKDAGATWSPVTAITGATPKGICNLTKIDAQHLVAVGRTNGPAHVLMSSDAGASWIATDLHMQMSMLIDAYFPSPNEGLIVGMGPSLSSVCTILRTTNGGKSYDKVFESATGGSLCWKISFPSPKIGYVAVQDSTDGPATFAKTVDGGLTWVEKPLPVKVSAAGGFPAIGIGFVTDKVGWVSPEEASLPTYRTKDGGETWEIDPALKSPINRFRFVDKETAYAIGAAVWKLQIDTTAH
ncbi:MAG TPA: hypothetical protein VLT33_37415 [Labilithrix sp.]|nr:hypothetical protein [Labilithrix sp.]